VNIIFQIILVLSPVLVANIEPPHDFEHYPPHFYPIEIGSNLNPTSMALGPESEVFVTEKDGKVLVFKNDKLREKPLIVINVDDNHERGLMNIVLHPKFETNGYFYLYYTAPGRNHNRVSRFQRVGEIASKETEKVLVDIDRLSGPLHNGGAMIFGNDGKLYISTGDGLNDAASQNKNSLLGKILRINDDGSIPEDNPYYNDLDGKYRSIYAMGLRNPFSLDLNPETGSILINDVGGAFYEEVNLLEKGANYGWPLIEGPISETTAPVNYRDPLHYYDHDVGCAIVGAGFSAPDASLLPPEYRGKFFYGDYCNESISILDIENPDSITTFANHIYRPVSIRFKDDGTMYVLERSGLRGGSEQANRYSKEGVLWKIIYNESGEPIVSRNPTDVLLSIGETAEFAVRALGDGALNYQWYKGGAMLENETTATLLIENVQLPDSGQSYYCIIQNEKGEAISNEAILRVTSEARPNPVISSSHLGKLYKAGDTIYFSGEVENDEHQNLPDSAFTWWVDFHHDEHTHPALTFLQARQGSVSIPTSGETSANVWYRIYLNTSLPSGLSKTVFRDVFPQKVNISIDTNPSNLQILLDGQTVSTPQDIEGVVGIKRSIQIVDQQLNDSLYHVFDKWDTGTPEQKISFETPAVDTTFQANYTVSPISEVNGLFAFYYGNQFDNYSGEPAAIRIDTAIWHDWGNESPLPGIIFEDEFSIKWSAIIQFPGAGKYSLKVEANDVGRLILNDTVKAESLYGGTLEHELVTNGPDSALFQIEFSDNLSTAWIRLYWSLNDGPYTQIPSTFFRPAVYLDPYRGREFTDLFTLYPNPANDFLNIRFLEPPSSNYLVEIVNSYGQVVSSKLILDENIEVKTTILSIADLVPGVYYVRIRDRNNNASSKRFIRLY